MQEQQAHMGLQDLHGVGRVINSRAYVHACVCVCELWRRGGGGEEEGIVAIEH